MGFDRLKYGKVLKRNRGFCRNHLAGGRLAFKKSKFDTSISGGKGVTDTDF